MQRYRSSVTQEEAKRPYDPETELRRASRELLRLQKYGLLLGIVSMNGVLIWAAATHHDHWYIFLPLLSANTFAQVFFALGILFSVACSGLRRIVLGVRDGAPETPETVVMLLPCYNEDRNEISASLKSLVRQEKISNHRRLIMIIVDGEAKGPGETVTTQQFLLDELLAGGHRTHFENG